MDGASLDVARILKACPNIKIFVTSRVPLHIYGENEYPLPPLSIPPRNAKKTHDKLMQFKSVQLFVARTRQHQPKFDITKENADAVRDLYGTRWDSPRARTRRRNPAPDDIG